MEGAPALPEQRAGFVLIRAIDGVTDATGWAAALGLVAMTAIVCFEIFARYVLNEPTYWGTEIATYLLVGMTFAGLALAQKARAHVRVELLLGWLPAGRRGFLELVALWIGLFFLLFAAWQMVAFNYQELVHDTRDWGLLATPQWIPELPVSLGYLAFVLAILADLFLRRPPASAFRRWVVPLLFAGLVALLCLLGPVPAKIPGTRLDWGSLAIAAVFLAAALAWSGPRVALAAGGLLAALALAYWAARGLPLLPVGLLLVGSLLLLLLIGVPVALALGLAGLLGVYFLLPLPQLSLLAERSWNSVNTFTLTAVPMFILMSGLLMRSGVTNEMFDALMRWFGRVPGGIAYASVSASTIFAAVSGSSLATAAAMGKVACPEMVRRGYSARLTYGVVAAGATLGIMIPPSIAMIIYGTTVGAPVNVLFIAGIVPGLILTVAFMLGVFIWTRSVPGSAPAGDSYSWREKLSASKGTFPFFLVIVGVLGSLYAGVATPSEAGGVGAALAFLLCVLRGTMSWQIMRDTAMETVRITSFLLLIVVGAAIFSWVFDYLRLPRSLVQVIQDAELAPWMVMAMIALIYIVLGMFIESISMMLMTLPVAYPIVIALGFDPIWFAVFLVLMIEVGLVTPPVGIILFVLRGMSGNVPLREIALGVLPFIAIILLFNVFIYLYPEVIAWLPSQMAGPPL
ncbi:MAG: TRAP transporter large permease subunit [Tistlia sp.]|uniref:TRAP transporter large permease subunit n=1 Tax=Tistlia sp. TaxID=3057121 RepID=UPI0034A5D114